MMRGGDAVNLAPPPPFFWLKAEARLGYKWHFLGLGFGKAGLMGRFFHKFGFGHVVLLFVGCSALPLKRPPASSRVQPPILSKS